MAAPTVPTPLTTINYSILSKLKLTPTPLGMRTFMIKFPAAIGPLLATSLSATLCSSVKGTHDRSTSVSLRSHLGHNVVIIQQQGSVVLAACKLVNGGVAAGECILKHTDQ